MKDQPALILASASPRRQVLLSHLITDFQVQAADIEESALPDETPEALVKRLSQEKAEHIALKNHKACVLGSDTVVALESTILGKPRDEKDFLGIMDSLSGRWHHVYTAVSLVHRGLTKTVLATTQVEFTQLTKSEINHYWTTGEPQDKAGGYAIQGIGGQFVKQIRGSVSAVIGLPLVETKQLLREAGMYH
ncbi:MAG: Maf family protein [Pseudomonadota bacterium]